MLARSIKMDINMNRFYKVNTKKIRKECDYARRNHQQSKGIHLKLARCCTSPAGCHVRAPSGELYIKVFFVCSSQLIFCFRSLILIIETYLVSKLFIHIRLRINIRITRYLFISIRINPPFLTSTVFILCIYLQLGIIFDIFLNFSYISNVLSMKLIQ